ncbi:MAG: 3-phosphoshikimate 1-carboxyvinyltransferase, partial [Proteobacteria bacterium]|nr:3-phosphoshikimate 1-carboxyvinyltransferase [Pseudomonadota bacterium]
MTKLDLDANLHGSVEMPGDKSISHRAIIFSSIGEGTAKVENCL